MSQKITEQMTIPEIVEKHPKTRDVFADYGIRVDGYKAIEYENLFATARVHEIDLDKLLADLNRVAAS